MHFFSRVHATLQPALSVRLSVGWSIGRSRFTFFYDFISLTSLLLPKWSGDLKYDPCPPARDFGSRVSGLVIVKKLLKEEQAFIDKQKDDLDATAIPIRCRCRLHPTLAVWLRLSGEP